MKFGDFSLESLDDLPKVEWNVLKLLWHFDYWDGPKNGMLSYQGTKYWFQVFDEPDNAVVFRRFLIVELLPEQLREEERWHELFRQKVGTHSDYDESGGRKLGALQPQEIWNEFYDAYKDRIPLSLLNNQIIGWFEY